jgi:hypothetical protein
MTTEELAELFLAHLYELADEAPHPNYLFSLNDFAPKLGLTDREELQKAINYLGDRGFIILASFDMFGGISAGITIEGSTFVERGGETGVIEQYRKNSQPVVGVPSDLSLPILEPERTEGVNEEKDSSLFALHAVEAILEDIANVLERDTTVEAEDKKDLLSDLATIRIQLGRNIKNRQIIHMILGNLSNIPSIAPFITGLNCIVEVYFVGPMGDLDQILVKEK